MSCHGPRPSRVTPSRVGGPEGRTVVLCRHTTGQCHEPYRLPSVAVVPGHGGSVRVVTIGFLRSFVQIHLHPLHSEKRKKKVKIRRFSFPEFFSLSSLTSSTDRRKRHCVDTNGTH